MKLYKRYFILQVEWLPERCRSWYFKRKEKLKRNVSRQKRSAQLQEVVIQIYPFVNLSLVAIVVAILIIKCLKIFIW